MQMAENPTEDEYNVKYTNNIVATSVTDTVVVKTNNAVENLSVKDRWADAGTAKNTTVTSSRKGQETYRATSKKGSYELVGTANAKATSYTDKKLKSGKTYYYKIRASKTTEAGADYFTTYSAVKSAKVK